MQKRKKGCESPQGGWGMGSKEPIRRNFLLSAVTISGNLSESSWFLYRMKPRLYKMPKLKITVKKGDPWGDSDSPKSTFKQNILLFILFLIKNSDIIRIKYSQKQFEITFGSAYFKPKKTKLKLVKMVNTEPRKARFPWGLGFHLGKPM